MTSMLLPALSKVLMCRCVRLSLYIILKRTGRELEGPQRLLPPFKGVDKAACAYLDRFVHWYVLCSCKEGSHAVLRGRDRRVEEFAGSARLSEVIVLRCTCQPR